MITEQDVTRLRKQARVTVAASIVIFVSMAAFVWFSQPKGFTDEAQSWSPSPEMIAKEIGTGKQSPITDNRHVQFGNLFKQRYRNHEIAVGIKFDKPGNVKFMCAAVTPRWDMARMGLMLFNEAKSAFGEPYKVDIVETYISAPSRKIGEVRAAPNGKTVDIVFSPLFSPVKPPMMNRLPNGDKPVQQRLIPNDGKTAAGTPTQPLTNPFNNRPGGARQGPRLPIRRVE